MKTNRSVKALMAAASLTVLTLGVSGAAHAHGDTIYWSIGMSSPGVQVGVASGPPVVVQPPMYMAARPVVVVQPAPVYYAQNYAHRGWSHHEHGRYVSYERGHERYEQGREGHGHDNRR